MFKQDNILTTFKLPIEYNNNKKEILPSMKADLELDVCKSVEKPLYHYVFNPESRLAKLSQINIIIIIQMIKSF